MTMTKNKIFFTKRGKFLTPYTLELNVTNADSATIYVPTILKNLEFYGYTLSEKAIEMLKHQPPANVISWYQEIIPILKETTGYIARKPMYPNFPQQVMDASMGELYINAIIHYMSLGTILPDYEVKERFPLIDNPKLKVIDFGNTAEFNSIFSSILSSKSSITSTDKEILNWFVDHDWDGLPEQIPMKEVLSYFTKLVWNTDVCETVLALYYKTATDILRLIVSLSNGDESLATASKIRNFSRPEMKRVWGALEYCNNIEEDMLRHREKWIAVGKTLHPEMYRKKFPKVNEAFKKLRDNEYIPTFNRKVEKYIENRDIYNLLYTLMERPGEYARRLDFILRTFGQSELVIEMFVTAAKRLTTPLLLQVMEHFSRNERNQDFRAFFPKGNISKVWVRDNNIEPVRATDARRIVQICKDTLFKLYSEREPMGKVYLDPDLKLIKVPTSLRSASRTVRTLARGSRLKIADSTTTIRSFLYWKKAGEDLDISCVFYGEKFKYINNVSFTHPKNTEYGCYHSGDITSAPNGACEYIDMDLAKLKAGGVKYVGLTTYSYSGIPFVNLEEAFMGYMERTDANTGEIFEPKTVKNKIDLATDSKLIMSMILDVDNREIVWTDLCLKNNKYTSNTVEGNQNTIKRTMEAMLDIEKPDMLTMLKLNVDARGERVNTKEEADLIFSLDEGITPYDTDIILSKYI